MALTSNNGKWLKKAKRHRMGGDRITTLPDSILIHILSFLPTVDAVRTCILSTRWKHIWASIPNLHFFFKDQHDSVFADFIDRVLFFHELPRIHRFCLECTEVSLSRLNTWVSVAIKRGVQELQIDVQVASDYVILPPTLFTSNTLVVFKLRNELPTKIPGPVHFPNLRVLHVSLLFPSKDMIQNLFCSCPVLEDFYMGGYVDDEAKAFNISTVALKKLEIDFYEPHDQCYLTENEFVINAPILEHLTLRNDCFALYRLENLSSLFRADIDVGFACTETYRLKECANQVYEVLKGISNVKYLTLGARTTEALNYADDNNMPLLSPNITHLKLHVNKSSCWKRLTYLLSCMPNLENLVLVSSIEKYFEPYDPGLTAEPNWIEAVPEQTPTCLLFHLKEIGITGFTSKTYHLNLIKYLLENAKVLIKMTISTCNLVAEEEVEFLRHLVTCQRGAQACTIELF